MVLPVYGLAEGPSLAYIVTAYIVMVCIAMAGRTIRGDLPSEARSNDTAGY